MRSLIHHLVQANEIEKINYPAQMTILKNLLTKYTNLQIRYAIDYYRNKGVRIYSFGYLKTGMKEALMAMETEVATATQVGDSSERNQRKFRKDNETFGREEHYSDLFKEPDEDNRGSEQ